MKVQTRIRELKNQWWMNISHEILQTAIISKVSFKKSEPSLAHPISTRNENTLLRDHKEIIWMWKEHFEELLNRCTNPNFEAIDSILPHPIKDTLGATPSLADVKTRIHSLKNNKASCLDNILAEVLKSAGQLMRTQIHLLITKIWVN